MDGMYAGVHIGVHAGVYVALQYVGTRAWVECCVACLWESTSTILYVPYPVIDDVTQSLHSYRNHNCGSYCCVPCL